MVALRRAVTPALAALLLAFALALATTPSSVHASASAHHAAHAARNHTQGGHGGKSAKAARAALPIIALPSPKPDTFDFVGASVVVSGSSTAKTATGTFTVVKTGGGLGVCRGCTPTPTAGKSVAADWIISGCITTRIVYTGVFYSGPNGVTTISLPLYKPPAGCTSYVGVMRLAFPTPLYNDVSAGLPYTPVARINFNVPLKW